MTGAPDAQSLVALVGSRIAHDLASPIGAIANGVELLGLSGLDAGPEVALITESVENATARIKLFRIAFGAAQPGQTVSAEEIAALSAGFGGARGLTVEWPLDAPVARAVAKPALLALMCVETAMPWGGAARVTHSEGRLDIRARADRVQIEPGLWAVLTGAAPAALTPAQVQFPLLAAEAAAQGRQIEVTQGDTEIRIAL